MQKTIALTAILAFFCLSSIGFATSNSNGKTFPFTEAEDHDGAKFVWFVYSQSKYRYDYIKAGDFPKSNRFSPSPNNKPQPGDVAWWKTFVAIYSPDKGRTEYLSTAKGKIELNKMILKLGPVRYFRYNKPD